MYSIGCLYLSGYSIVSLQWSPVVSLAAPPLVYLRDLCCPVSVLAARRAVRSAARGEFLVPRTRLAIIFRFWVHQHGMISPLSCVPCCSILYLSEVPFLSVTGLGAPLSSSLLKRRYISLQN